MKNKLAKDSDDMRSEYDLTKLKFIGRGIYAERYRSGTNIVKLDPDIRQAFPDDESVNEVLRAIVRATGYVTGRQQAPSKKRTRNQMHELKVNCRVLAKSKGRTLYKTPIRTSAPRKRSDIIRYQRKWLEQEHPQLRRRGDVDYVLQWFKNGHWVTDNGETQPTA